MLWGEVMEMEPAVFGPFLKEARGARGLTQGQLAEKLHVSTAAVSKWERGKCLPDVAKLRELADALELSVPELLDGARQTGGAPKTATPPGRGRRRALAALCLAALACALWLFPVYRIAEVWSPAFFDTGEVSLLAFRGSRADRETARPVLELAEEAFSDLDAGAREKYGLLGRYCVGDPRAVSERHSLTLWTARFTASEGYMWVHYSQTARDAGGGTVTGSRDIPALWFLERGADGRWSVTHIKEHP
jgi:transcriptional regulator with XRE-family HTH domain